MSYIITSPCIGVCDTSCVDVCPVDCIHGPLKTDGSGSEVAELKEKEDGLKGLQLFIDPETCIVCGACLPECPVNAIYGSEDEVPEEERASIRKNYEFFGQTCPPEYM
ncbi:MAG: 4Fe-4S dicluster domain-containing protein [Bacteroidetes bacterium]|nr:MAG: 4Fe-4S dicluster domain-containing protein [Bacteroidota bacterium]REK00058.1 MAG: 4Fe-4S dicluster domain-containing protein [Bacteroidota bacterium]REK32936.1 MAG: 4Fe-4S dicluster domain-containing protein [Bacteroidota bacterium]REK47743.1 MAG: 4Fe-4S dicluster domain-containing protein [Bacteroidota bacterium]